MVILRGCSFSEDTLNVFRKGGAAVVKLDFDVYAITFSKKELTLKDFRGSQYYNALRKRYKHKYKQERQERRKGRKKFILARKKRFGRGWKTQVLAIKKKKVTALLFSLTRPGMKLKYNNGFYTGKFIVDKIYRYPDKQVKAIRLTDVERKTGSVTYIFPKIKIFSRLIKRLYTLLWKRKTHEWLIRKRKV